MMTIYRILMTSGVRMNLKKWITAVLGGIALMLVISPASFAQSGLATCSDMSLSNTPDVIPSDGLMHTIVIQATDNDVEIPPEEYKIKVIRITSRPIYGRRRVAGIGSRVSGADPSPIVTSVQVLGAQPGARERIYNIWIRCWDAAAPKGALTHLFVTVSPTGG
jgi:hypothetical protein